MKIIEIKNGKYYSNLLEYFDIMLNVNLEQNQFEGNKYEKTKKILDKIDVIVSFVDLNSSSIEEIKNYIEYKNPNILIDDIMYQLKEKNTNIECLFFKLENFETLNNLINYLESLFVKVRVYSTIKEKTIDDLYEILNNKVSIL